MSTVHAGNINFGPPGGGFSGPGTNTLFGTTNPGTSFENIISTTVGVMSIVAGIWFFFLIITGGIAIISAGGDKGQVESARKRITGGFTGLLVVLFAVGIAALVSEILGVNFLNLSTFISGFGTF